MKQVQSSDLFVMIRAQCEGDGWVGGGTALVPGVQYLIGYWDSVGTVLFWNNVHLHHHKLHKSFGGAEVHKGVPPKLCSTHICH